MRRVRHHPQAGGDIWLLIAYGASMLELKEQDDLIALLEWYQQMGVDAIMGVEPTDWFSRGDIAPGASIRADLRAITRGPDVPAPRKEPPQNDAITPPSQKTPKQRARAPLPAGGAPTPPPTRQFSTKAPDEAVISALSKARSAKSLIQLQEILDAFDGCALKATAKNLCFYRGAETARIMVIGEAPGRDEDLAGSPFVGRAGKLLDKMLTAIDLDERNCHITNIVYWRPPGNRTPTAQEAQVCRPFLERQIELVGPEIILLLGGAAAKNIFNASEGIMRLRGKWRDLSFRGSETGSTADSATSVPKIKALATLHPAYLLRTPAAKRLAWRDLLMIKSALEVTGSDSDIG